MIQPLKQNSNINFKSNSQLSAANAAIINKTAEKQVTAQPQVEKKSVVQAYDSAKKTVTDVFKKVNTVVGVGTGATRGVVEGVLAASVVGVVGKNIKNAKGQIGGTLKGIAKDTWSAVKVVPKAIKNVWKNSPKDNLAKLFKETIPTGTKKIGAGLKNHKKTAAIATSVGLLVFATRTILGKVKANYKNSSLDHATNQGHV